MTCKCKPSAPRDLSFTACERGFIFRSGREYEGIGKVYAFDRVEDAAAWLVEQFTGEAS